MKKTYLALLLSVICFQKSLSQISRDISYQNVVESIPSHDGVIANYSVWLNLKLTGFDNFEKHIESSSYARYIEFKAIIVDGVRYNKSELPINLVKTIDSQMNTEPAPNFSYNIYNGGAVVWKASEQYGHPRWISGEGSKWIDLFEKGNLSIRDVVLINLGLDMSVVREYLRNKKNKETYKDLVKSADVAYSQHDYQKAQRFYIEASELFPQEAYPKKQLKKTEEKLNEADKSTSSGGQGIIVSANKEKQDQLKALELQRKAPEEIRKVHPVHPAQIMRANSFWV